MPGRAPHKASARVTGKQTALCRPSVGPPMPRSPDDESTELHRAMRSQTVTIGSRDARGQRSLGRVRENTAAGLVVITEDGT